MLSNLQKYILKACMQHKGTVALEVLIGDHKVIRTSIDRLIKKELLVGYGSKTPHKLYISRVRLTAKGRKAVAALMPKQQRMF